MEVSVFSVQVSASMFLFPDLPPAENPTPETFKYGAWSLGFHRLQHSITPILQGHKQNGLPPHLELRCIRTQ